MINAIKKRIHSIACTAVTVLILLQIIMPVFVDLILGLVILGIVYAVPKVSTENEETE